MQVAGCIIPRRKPKSVFLDWRIRREELWPPLPPTDRSVWRKESRASTVNPKVFLSCRIVGMASGDRGLAVPLCDHSRCVGSPPEADVLLCPKVSFQDRLSRCDVPLCRRVSICPGPALTGFEADGAPVENLPSALRSGSDTAPLSGPECRILLFASGSPLERRGGVWRPKCRAGQRNPPTRLKSALAWPLRSRPMPPPH